MMLEPWVRSPAKSYDPGGVRLRRYGQVELTLATSAVVSPGSGSRLPPSTWSLGQLMRYPAPGIVWTTSGAPSVRRSRPIMIISVLERRSEVGLRRALGATRAQIRTQFLAEAIMLALLGGAVGVIAGAVATVIYASTRNWAAVIPPEAWAGGIGAAIAIGALAGLLPALRAARMSPTEALRTV
jgi:FtsX-like permease family